MSSAASVRPFRRAVLRSLRELTRLAVTALVLAVGLGGALAVAPPPGAATPLRPASVSSRVDSIRPEAAPRLATDAAPTRPTRPFVAAPAIDNATAAPDDAPRTGSGRGTPSRRGPPAV
ncbi:hypothetical protein ACFOW4_23385 [Micromonospora sp. GCM10011542]|uniref:hypothetical protein n=1 Tax=Micromonospora sp. GCM10011542 TaxID=3317337 RepID=UPI0036127641